MAQGEFILKFKIEGDPKGAKVISAEVDKAANAQTRLGGSTRQATEAQEGQNKTMRDGVRGTANSTKSFSKLAETVGGGLVGAYAALAANIFAVSAAFNALRGAQQAQMVLQGLETQGARTGRTLTLAAEGLREIVRFGIDSQTAMQSTAQFTAAGFSIDELERLGAVADNTSLALGRNLTDSMERLIRGTVKLEPELLDELGIMTKIGEATRVYALQNNKTEASLTSFERRQAFLNAVLAEGEAKFGGINESIDANPYDQLAASFSNLTKDFLGFINNTLGVGSAVKYLADNAGALTGVLLLFGSTIKGQILGSMADLSRLSVEAAREQRKQALATIEGAKAAADAAKQKKLLALTEANNISLHSNSAKALRNYQTALKSNKLSVEEYDAAINTNARSIRSHEALLRKGNDTLKDGTSRAQLINDLQAQTKALEDAKAAHINYANSISKETVVKRQLMIANTAELRAKALESRATAVQNVSLTNLNGTYTALARSSALYAASLRKQTMLYEMAAAEGNKLAAVQARLSAATIGVRTAAFAAAGAVQVLGSALLKSLGWIGGALIVWDMLKSAYEALYKWIYPETAKAQEELNEVMSNFDEILTTATRTASEYNRIMGSQASLSSRIIGANTAVASSIQEIVNQYNEAIIAVDELAAARERDARNASPISQMNTQSVAAQMIASGQEDAVRQGLLMQEALLQAQEDAANSLESRLFKNISDGGEEVEATRKLIQGLETQLGPERLQRVLESAGIAVDSFTNDNLRDLGEVANDVSREAGKIKDALETLGQAFREGEEQSTKFIQSLIPRTPYDEVISNYTSINNALSDLQSTLRSTTDLVSTSDIAGALSGIGPDAATFLNRDAQETLRLLSESASLYQAQKDNLDNLSGAERERVNRAKEIVDSAGQHLTFLRESFSQAEEILINMRAQVALAGAQASLEQARLSKFSDYLQVGAAGLRARINLEERIARLQVVGLQAEKAIVDAKIAQKEAAILNLEQQQLEIDAQIERLRNEERITEQYLIQTDSLLTMARQRAAPNNPFALDQLSPRLRNSLTQQPRSQQEIQNEQDRELADLTRRSEEVGQSIDTARKELLNMRLASQTLGTQIAAGLMSILSPAAQAIKEQLADLELEQARVARRLEKEQIQSQIRISRARLTNIRLGIDEELDLRLRAIREEARMSRAALEATRKAEEDILEKRYEDAVQMSQERGVTNEIREGARATALEISSQLGSHRAITAEMLTQADLQLELNVLEAVGLNKLEERLDLMKDYVELQQRLSEITINYDRSRQELRRARETSIATILNIEIPGETIRVMEREQEFRRRQNDIEKQRIDLEYQLLGAQYALEREKMKVIQANSEVGSAQYDAATQAIAAYDEFIGSGVGSGTNSPVGDMGTGLLETARVQQNSILDNEVISGDLEIQEARVREHVDILIAQFAKLGPEGEAMSTLITGMSGVAYSIEEVFKSIETNGARSLETMSSIATAASAMLSTISSVIASTTDAKIANIDREIAAEQKRDGKSAESVAKIEAMEKKKDAIARKAFNTNKKIQMAQAVISTATGVARALELGPILGPIMAGVIGAMGAAQMAIIASTSYQSASPTTASVSSPASLTIGRRDNRVDLARGPNPNAGGEEGYIRGSQGYGNNAYNYSTIGSAYGGNMTRGYGKTGFVVGEKGPEVITPEVPISVTPADKVGSGQNINASFSIHAIDAAGVQQLLLSQRGNIITMLREAANANGETFLEDVNTNVYTSPSVGKLI